MLHYYQFCEFSLSCFHLSTETGNWICQMNIYWLKIPWHNDVTFMLKKLRYALPCFTLFYSYSKKSKSVLILSLTLAVFALLPILQIFLKSQPPIGRLHIYHNWFLLTKNSSLQWCHFQAKKVQMCSTLFYLISKKSKYVFILSLTIVGVSLLPILWIFTNIAATYRQKLAADLLYLNPVD